MAKRTVIAPDDELLVQGKLTITGNVTQVETTQVVNNFESEQLVINSDGDDVNAILTLNKNGVEANLVYDGSNIVISQPISVTGGNITSDVMGNVIASNGDVILNHVTGVYTGSLIGNVTGEVSSLANHDTGDLVEGVNLYHTTARARDSLSGIDGISYNNSSGIISLASTTAGNGLVYASGVLTVGQGDGVTINPSNIAVDSTVVRTSGNQSIADDKTFTGNIKLGTGAHILSDTANTSNIGTSQNHINHIYANVVHAERLDLSDADLTDIHATFYAGTPTGNIVPADSSTGGGLIYEHKEALQANSGGYYRVNTGDGIEISSDAVSVDNTVVRTNVIQTISANTTFTGTIDLTGATAIASTQANTDNSNNIATTAYVKTAIADLIDGAPGALDTLNELANALNDDSALGSKVTNNTGNITALQNRTLTAGNGLTGGGNLTADRTFTVGQGDGINVNSANIAVDNTVVRTTGDQSLANVKTFTGELVIPSVAPTSNNAIYVDNGANIAYITINGTAVQLTADSDVGQVEDVGATGTDIYAGFRQEAVGNSNITYHGIKSINSGSYTTIADASNVITIDGNASAIRNLISVTDVSGDGSLSYDNANGIISYTGPSASEVRAHISATGLVDYNNTTGVISTTADNYGSWKFTTASTGNIDVGSGNLVTFAGSSGVSVSHANNIITISGVNADIESVTAGSGLTGGGASGNVTLTVGAGYGITVTADAIETNNANIRALFTGGTGITYNAESGVFSLTDTGYITGVTAGNGLSGGGTTGTVTLSLPETGPGANVYGSADDDQKIDSITLDAYGRVTAISTGPTGDITGVTAGTGLSGGGTSGNITINVANLTVSELEANAIQTSSEDFADNDTSLMTSAAIQDKIESYGYDTGTVTSVFGGPGLTGSVTTTGTLSVGAGSYILVGADEVSVDATSENTANKVVARDANGDFSAGVVSATSTSAQYADLAENYTADAYYEPGTVLTFGGENEVTQSTSDFMTSIAGVVSTDPAHLMNSMCPGEHVAPVALRGRIPCKVIGIVNKGDVLVTSYTPGYAMAAPQPDTVPAACIIGRSLDNKTDKGPGIIEAVV